MATAVVVASSAAMAVQVVAAGVEVGGEVFFVSVLVASVWGVGMGSS
ncbi:hypothetical protein [Gordonia sputi]